MQHKQPNKHAVGVNDTARSLTLKPGKSDSEHIALCGCMSWKTICIVGLRVLLDETYLINSLSFWSCTAESQQSGFVDEARRKLAMEP